MGGAALDASTITELLAATSRRSAPIACFY
jgi:hypothetical protein